MIYLNLQPVGLKEIQDNHVVYNSTINLNFMRNFTVVFCNEICFLFQKKRHLFFDMLFLHKLSYHDYFLTLGDKYFHVKKVLF